MNAAHQQHIYNYGGPRMNAAHQQHKPNYTVVHDKLRETETKMPQLELNTISH